MASGQTAGGKNGFRLDSWQKNCLPIPQLIEELASRQTDDRRTALVRQLEEELKK